MNNLKKDFRDLFDNVNISDTHELKNNIILKYQTKQKNKKIIFSIFTVFVIFLTSLGIVHADDIKDSVNKIITKISHRESIDNNSYDNYQLEVDVKKELNFDAKLEAPKCTKVINGYDDILKNDDCYTTYTVNELEQLLGIKLLKNKLFEKDNYVLKKLNLNDGKIANISLELMNPLNSKKNNPDIMHVRMQIFIVTKYNRQDVNKIWEVNASSNNDYRKYFLKKLNTEAIISKFGKRLNFIFFVYDDIIYRLDITKTDLKLNDKDIENLLDSFYY